MGLKYDPMSRRQFLLGLGGASLALPLLPSLLSRDVRAATLNNSRRLTIFKFGHNTMAGRWIDPALATRPTGSIGAKELTLSTYAGPIGEPMTHDVYETLKQKGVVTVLRGLDCVNWTSGHGGAFTSTVENRPPGLPNTSENKHFQSIDCLVEDSPTVYPSNTPPEILKAVRCRTSGIKRLNPNAGIDSPASDFAEVPGYTDPGDLYQDLFGGLPPADAPPPSGPADPLRYNIVQRVHEAYKQATTSRRISVSDRLRLEEHVALLRDAETKLSSVERVTVTCTVPTAPAPISDNYSQELDVFLDLMAMAIKCGLTKVLSMGFDGEALRGDKIPGLSPTAYLHNGVFHNEGHFTNDQIADYYVIWKKWHLDKVAERFLRQLDVEEPGTGRTYLDNGVVAVLAESGMIPNGAHFHENRDYQPVLFGSLGGYLKTDRYVLFERKMDLHPSWRFGLPYNQLMLTLAAGMGMSPAEYIQNGSPGYGNYDCIPNLYDGYTNQYGSIFHLPIQEIVA